MIDEVMFEIRELSGQEYVDTYATKKAEGLPTEARPRRIGNGHGETEAPAAPSSADVLNPFLIGSFSVASAAMADQITIRLPDGSTRAVATGTTGR